MNARKIERNRLGDQVFDILLEEIEQGKHQPDEHIGEAKICAELQVSRTPVREALFRLEQQGFLVSRPNQGFFVAAASKQLVAESYPVLGALEALAIRLSPPLNKTAIRKLESANKRIIRKNASAQQLFSADMDFHNIMISQCGNRSLLKMIASAKSSIGRWDGGKRRGMADPERAYLEHAHVISRLREGNHDSAASLIESHWNRGIETVTGWIENEQQAGD